MIIKIMSRGRSFKGVANYVLHDPKEKTNERVGFTYTRNLALDDALSAVNEMYQTANYAEMLKQEAGIRAGGRDSDRPVKHISLNWSPDEQPSPEHMRQTADGFLKHMGWHEHQALFVAHNDKHPHLHIVLNMVHPETGVLLNDSFEKRRAQSWALNYEIESGKILCEQRVLNADEREASPTRPAWMIFKENEKNFAALDPSLRKNDELLAANENAENSPEYSHWKKLKEFQRDERLSFVAETKMQIKDLRDSIYREVREEFREKWSEYYDQQKAGDFVALKELKAKLIAEQKQVLEDRCKEPFAELRELRNVAYRELLNHQIDIRVAFKERQEAGLDNGVFLDQLDKAALQRGIRAVDADNRERPTARGNERETTGPVGGHGMRDTSGVKPALTIATGAAEGIGFSMLSLFESIADGIMGAKPTPRRHVPREPEPNPKSANDNPPRAVEQSRQDDEIDWYQQQRSRGRD
jgi:Relaxase/Mobilisation nuclease domain